MLALHGIKFIDRDIAVFLILEAKWQWNYLEQELDQMKRRRRELKEQAVRPKIQTCSTTV